MTNLKGKIPSKLALYLLIFVISGFTNSTMAQQLDLSGRTDRDLKRDITRMPAQIIEFAGVNKGDKVLDFLGGYGYYSEILKRAVGPEGSVVLHNHKSNIDYFGQYMSQLEDKGYLADITKLQSEADNLKLGREQFDIIFLVLSYHDFYYRDTGWEFDVDTTVLQLFQALKPSGKLLLIDHSSAPGRGMRDAQELHRIEDTFVKNDLEKRGFKLIKQSEILRNENDDYAVSVFDKKVRKKTDRFVMLFEKSE